MARALARDYYHKCEADPSHDNIYILKELLLDAQPIARSFFNACPRAFYPALNAGVQMSFNPQTLMKMVLRFTP